MAESKKLNLVDFLIRNSNSKFVETVKKSRYFNEEDEFVETDIPLLNVGLSGSIRGGISNGIVTIAGEEKRFKTLYGLHMINAYLKKYDDAVCLYYDTEGGAGKRYFKMLGIDESRVVWIPCPTIEFLRTEVAKQIDELQKLDNPDNHIIIFVDSIGNIASNKEVNDAVEGSEKADMTRAKAIKSFFRIVTLPLKLLKIPMIVIGHTYKTQSFIPEDVISGGSGSKYGSNTIWIINKRQLKDNNNSLEGFTFEINIFRSRFVKEKAKLPINVYYGEGIAKYSGLSELAIDLKVIEKTKIGRSPALKYKDEEILEKGNDRDEEFWSLVLEDSDLAEKIKEKYSLDTPYLEESDE